MPQNKEQLAIQINALLAAAGYKLAIVGLTPKTQTPVPIEDALQDGWAVTVDLVKKREVQNADDAGIPEAGE